MNQPPSGFLFASIFLAGVGCGMVIAVLLFLVL